LKDKKKIPFRLNSRGSRSQEISWVPQPTRKENADGD